MLKDCHTERRVYIESSRSEVSTIEETNWMSLRWSNSGRSNLVYLNQIASCLAMTKERANNYELQILELQMFINCHTERSRSIGNYQL